MTIQVDSHEGDGRPARKTLDLPLIRVSRIEVERHDSLIDGAIFGALYVAACARWWCAQGLDGPPSLPRDVYLGAGLGALVGASIDAVFFKKTTIYRAGGGASAKSRGPGLSYILRF